MNVNICIIHILVLYIHYNKNECDHALTRGIILLVKFISHYESVCGSHYKVLWCIVPVSRLFSKFFSQFQMASLLSKEKVKKIIYSVESCRFCDLLGKICDFRFLPKLIVSFRKTQIWMSTISKIKCNFPIAVAFSKSKS